MTRRVVAFLIVTLWIAFLGWVVYQIQDREISKLVYQRPYRDTLNLPEPETAKVMALGYDNMGASLLWLRIIQAFGAKLHHIRENPLELKAIENVFNVITELDPRFIDAYKFGNFVLGDEGGDTTAALRLLDRGILRNYKRTYVLPYEAVFICIANQDYDKARYYTKLALKAPDAPEYVARMIQYLDVKKGNYEIAIERWVRDDLQAYRDRNAPMLVVTRNQVLNVAGQWHISIINKAIDKYFEIHQDYPPNLEALEAEGLIGKVRQLNGPRLIQLMDSARQLIDSAGGRPESVEQAIEAIMSEKSGVVFESDRLPRDTNGEPYLLVDSAVPPVQSRPSPSERRSVRPMTRGALEAIRRRLEEFKEAYRRYPMVLEELPAMQGPTPELRPEDPAGLPWKYDPLLGRLSSHVFPEL